MLTILTAGEKFCYPFSNPPALPKAIRKLGEEYESEIFDRGVGCLELRCFGDSTSAALGGWSNKLYGR